jgi:hypothetical protein
LFTKYQRWIVGLISTECQALSPIPTRALRDSNPVNKNAADPMTDTAAKGHFQHEV